MLPVIVITKNLTFLRVLLREAVPHLCDDLPQLPRVLLDGELLLRVEVRLHRLAQHDLREDGAQAVGGGPRLCNFRGESSGVQVPVIVA